jgi:hypothetical protein
VAFDWLAPLLQDAPYSAHLRVPLYGVDEPPSPWNEKREGKAFNYSVLRRSAGGGFS